MKFNNYNRAVITNALKRSNQRLVQLSKTLNPNSAILSHQLAPFQNGSYDKYLTTSKSGFDKFNIRSIMKDIESGKLDPSEANDFLVKAAGVRLSPDGEATATSEGGIDTISETKKKARDILGDKLSDQDLLQKYDDIVSTRDNFQFDYDAFAEEFGPEVIESNPITSKLFKGGLTYDELIEVHKEMESELNKVRNKAITYGGN